MLKRTIAALILVFALLVGTSIVSGQVLLEEDFENVETGKLPAGWGIIEGEPGVYTDHAKSGSKALRIQPLADGATGVYDYVYAPFDQQYEKVVIEYWAYTPGAAGRGLAFSLSRQVCEEKPDETYSVEAGPYLNVRSGVLSYFAGGWKDLGGIDVAKWNKFKVDVDIKKQSFKVYVNDSLMGEGMFRSSVDSLGLAVFTIFQAGAPSEVAWVDDIKVYVP